MEVLLELAEVLGFGLAALDQWLEWDTDKDD